jgi:molybdopterin-guanine dinucleotide biosynthesis protein A
VKQRTDISGAILAGGKSTRMGKEKALLEFHGKPFIKHIAETLSRLFEHIVVVADEPSRFEFLHLPVVPDVFKNCGPLGGIHSALVYSSTERVFVVSCDTPLLQPEFISFLLDDVPDNDVLVPSVGSFVHPICGMYKKSCIPVIEEWLTVKKYSVLQFLQTQQTKKVELSVDEELRFGQSLQNINTPEEYQNLISYF